MADGCGEAAWYRTFAILSLTFNMNRDPKKERARYPDYFNPYASTKVVERRIENLGEIKHLFVPPK